MMYPILDIPSLRDISPFPTVAARLSTLCSNPIASLSLFMYGTFSHSLPLPVEFAFGDLFPVVFSLTSPST